MIEKGLQVKKVARLAKVTVRTLHHYDSMGLLVPSDRTQSGYRLYSDEDLMRLQQILLHRELGFSLERISEILNDPEFDRREALFEQREQLKQRAHRTEAMIRSVNEALATLENVNEASEDARKGKQSMDTEKLFEGFNPADYQEETRQRWGNSSAYRDAARRTKGYSKADWERIRGESDRLMSRIEAKLREGAKPSDDEVTALAEEHRLHIDRWFYPCEPRMHAGLADLYVTDPRFNASIDRHGEGLAVFLAEAIRANAARSTNGDC